MKFLISGLRTLVVALAALLLFIILSLSLGWHTPLVNYFAAPYKVSVSHTELDWFPLSLQVDGLEAGEGDAAFYLDQLSVRSGLGFLTGKPVELYVLMESGQISYQLLSSGQGNSDWQVAGLGLKQWQQLFSPARSSEADRESEADSAVQSPLTIHLQSLQISDFSVDSLQDGLPDIQLDRLLFGPFHTDQPEKSSSLQVELATAGGQLNLKGALAPLSAKPRANFDIVLQNFAPGHAWLAQLPKELSGTLNTKLALSLSLPESEVSGGLMRTGLQAQLTGDLALAHAAWQPLIPEAGITEDFSIVEVSSADASPDEGAIDEGAIVESATGDGPDEVQVEEINVDQKAPVISQPIEEVASDSDGSIDQAQTDTNKRERYSFDTLSLKGIALDIQIADFSDPKPVTELKVRQLQSDNVRIYQGNLSFQLQSLLFNQLQSKTDFSQADSPVQLIFDELKLNSAAFSQSAQRYLFESLQLSQFKTDAILSEPKAQLSFDQLRISAFDMHRPDLSYQLQALSLQQLTADLDYLEASIESGALDLLQGAVSYQQQNSQRQTKEQQQSKKVVADAAADSAEMEPKKRDQKSIQQVNGEDDTGIAEAESSPYQIRFSGESIQLNNHQISYTDLNLEDSPLTQIELKEIKLSQPRYPALEPFPWTADIWLNGQSHWQIKGGLQTAPLKVDMKIQQSGLSLPDISPYSEHYADVVFDQGMMDNRIQLEITPDSLKGSLGFDFNNLDMTLKGSQANLNLPLQTAFSLLEDSDSRIELSIDLDKQGKDFEVGTKAIVKELILAASQKGAVAYLKYALQPYGALLTLKEVGSSLLRSGSLPLEPVLLNPSQEAFTVDQQGYARKVGDILKNKKRFNLDYCYIPSESEREQLLQQLGDAAKADAAYKEMNQTRLTQWRKLFAEQGLASRINQCTQAELNKQRKGLKPGEARQSLFMLLLKP